MEACELGGSDPETQGSPKCRKLITNSKGKRRNISIFSTCQGQTDHEIVGLLSPERLGPQHAHNDEEVAEHRQEDDREEHQALGE